MKKILFSLLLVAAMSANAQTFDEVNLIGTWRLDNFSEKFPYGITFDSIVLGDVAGVDGGLPCSGFITGLAIPGSERYNGDSDSEKSIPDFFISNNNKLHIIVGDDFALRFVIEELTSSSLKAKTYDGHRFTFVKDNSSSGVKPMTQTHSADDSIYNLNGQKVEDVTTNGVYIQNGQKKVVKK